MNSTWKRIVCSMVLLCLWTQSALALKSSEITGTSAVLIDAETGQVLFDKNSATPMYPASTTKIMTALLVLEDSSLSDIVTIDGKAPFTDGSRIYLMEGEKLTVEQLLYGLMLSSANDAAVALAINHSGTLEDFIVRMNQRAKELGAQNTHFKNPNGLPDTEHVTSTYDLALIAREAMKNATFRKLVTTVSYQIGPTNKQPEIRYLRNGNKLLFGVGAGNTIGLNGQNVDIKWDLVDGIKTGYTTVARQCLVASASKDGRRVIAVVFKSEGKDIYKDARLLLEYGLGSYINKRIVQSGNPLGQLYFTDKKLPLLVTAAEDRSITLPAGNDSVIPEPELAGTKNLNLPIQKGQVVGEARYTLANGQAVAVPLKAAANLEENALLKRVGKVVLMVAKVMLSAAVCFLLWRTIVTHRRMNKRKKLRLLKEKAAQAKKQDLWK